MARYLAPMAHGSAPMADDVPAALRAEDVGSIYGVLYLQYITPPRRKKKKKKEEEGKRKEKRVPSF